MWRIAIEDDDGERTIVPLQNDVYRIGRGNGNELRLTNRNVSRQHAQLACVGDAYIVEDLESSLGTYVNMRRIAAETRVRAGDVIVIGDYAIYVEADSAAEVAVPAKRSAQSLPPRIVVLDGPQAGSEFPITKEQTLIGRADTDVVILHKSVSRLHCALTALSDGHFEIVDQGSTNGITWNGIAVKQAIVHAGDRLTIGDVALRFDAGGNDVRPARRGPDQVPLGRSRPALVTLLLLSLAVAVGAILGLYRHHG